MNKEKNPLSQRILDLTLEIIYLLTGEDHILVKIPSWRIAKSKNQTHERYCDTTSPNVEPLPLTLPLESNNEKILELSNQIIHLLTGEVPIRCEDVTVHLSTEEWEYVEQHKDLYKEVMKEDHQPVTTLDACHSPASPPDLKTINDPENITNKGITFQNNHNNLEQANAGPNPTYVLMSSENGSLLDIAIYPHIGQSQTEYPPTYITNEPVSREEGTLVSQGNEQFKCTECGKVLSRKSNLIKHYRTHMGEKPYKRSDRKKGFPFKTDRATHRRIHTGEKPFKCTECGKCFTRASPLASHKMIHTREKSHRCNECGKCFPLKSRLAEHLRIHTGEKPFKCSECGKGFARASNLAAHKLIHTGEKPFNCTECRKCFTLASGLAAHRMIHERSKPHKCIECGKCFSCPSHLKRHRMIHTGEKPFKCTDCEKCFSRASDLAVHERIHSGEKLFLCGDCGKGFTRRYNLVQHQKIHTRG